MSPESGNRFRDNDMRKETMRADLPFVFSARPRPALYKALAR